MQKIIPYFWFDGQAEEAARYYTDLFPNSSIGKSTYYGDDGFGVKGSVMTVDFKLAGQDFVALNGGPEFSFTPAISMMVRCDSLEEINNLWDQLSDEGNVLMELDSYPFSERFGWLADRYGVSWQLNLNAGGQKITPCFMFVGEQHGKAEAAMKLYTSLFKDSGISAIHRYEPGQGELAGTVMQGMFTLAGQSFIAMDSGLDHNFTFTNALSLLVNCEDQAEIDRLWEAFSNDGQVEECGWLKDAYGVSWQIVPAGLKDMLQDENQAKSQAVIKAVMKMTKLDTAALEAAYREVN